MYQESLVAPGFQLSKVLTRFPISSISFNPKNPKELLVSGLCDIIIITLKKDGSSEGNDKTLVTRSPQLISKAVWVSESYIAYLIWSSIVVLNVDTK